MNKDINGICMDGEFYELVKGGRCEDCHFFYKSRCRLDEQICYAFDDPSLIFRHSPELTDKINSK